MCKNIKKKRCVIFNRPYSASQEQQGEYGMETDFLNISQHLVSSLCQCYYQ